MGTIWILLFTVLSSGGGFAGGMGSIYDTQAECLADDNAETRAVIIDSVGLTPGVDVAIHCVPHAVPPEFLKAE